MVLLGWVSFFADVSGEMVYPLLPLFVVGVLGASATSLGWVEGVAMAVVAVLTAVAGWRSDRIRRRVPYVQIGYGIPVIGKTILVFAVAWPMVLVGRTIDRIGKGIRSSPRDALIADSTEPGDRGRAFGLHRAMDTAGAFVGVLVSAGLLLWLTDSPTGAGTVQRSDESAFRIVFVVSAILSLAAVALTFLLREPPHHAAPAEVATSEKRGRLGMSRQYWAVVTLLLIFSLANSSDTFLLLRASQVGMRPWEVVLAYALFNLVYTVGSYPAGVLSDRIGRWRVIAVGWVFYIGVYAGFALTGTTGVWPLFATYGIYMALTDGVGKALVADHAPRDRRGFALGVFYLATGATTLVGSIVAGLLWDRIGPAAPFWFGAIVAAVAVVLIPIISRARAAAPT